MNLMLGEGINVDLVKGIYDFSYHWLVIGLVD